jgi:hypothetical protein
LVASGFSKPNLFCEILQKTMGLSCLERSDFLLNRNHHHKPFAGAVAPLRLAPQKRKEMAPREASWGIESGVNFSEEERRRLLEQRESPPRSGAAFDTKTNDDSGVRRRVVLAAFLLGTVAVAAVTGAAVSSGAPLASSRGKGAAAAEEAAVLDKSAVRVMSASSSSSKHPSKTTSFTAANERIAAHGAAGADYPWMDGVLVEPMVPTTFAAASADNDNNNNNAHTAESESSLSTWRVVSVSKLGAEVRELYVSPAPERRLVHTFTDVGEYHVERRLATSGTGSDAEEDVGKVYVRYVRREIRDCE